ncbi:hypothetical protein [Bacteroides sp. 51]|uniref:hypothetical protein n=1 Tax=Bacteroides sp. 51 TaxID=2302938 RepID=UPI0019402745|nr:hypothetical protein [Bacteroides sp. 51]
MNEYNNIEDTRPNMKSVKIYIKAWNAKVKPIFLTIVPIVLGSIPFMIGEYKEAFWFPSTAGTIGSLVLSLIALFVFLPMFMGVVKNLIVLAQKKTPKNNERGFDIIILNNIAVLSLWFLKVLV